MKTVLQQWDSYRNFVVPKTAGQVQLNETRQAFYAGAAAMFSLMSSAAAESASDDIGASRIDRLSKELSAFAKNIGKPS